MVVGRNAERDAPVVVVGVVLAADPADPAGIEVAKTLALVVVGVPVVVIGEEMVVFLLYLQFEIPFRQV